VNYSGWRPLVSEQHVEREQRVTPLEPFFAAAALAAD